MKRAIRRRYDDRGLAKVPQTLLQAMKRGCVTVVFRCIECGHKGERPIDEYDPLTYCPDVGLAMRCSKCSCTEIESWPTSPSIVAERSEPYVYGEAEKARLMATIARENERLREERE
jgi:hypothetical protein